MDATGEETVSFSEDELSSDIAALSSNAKELLDNLLLLRNQSTSALPNPSEGPLVIASHYMELLQFPKLLKGFFVLPNLRPFKKKAYRLLFAKLKPRFMTHRSLDGTFVIMGGSTKG